LSCHPPVYEALQEFDDESAKVLHSLATRMEGTGKAQQADLQGTFERFEQVVRSHSSGDSGSAATPQLQAFLQLTNRLKDLAISLNEQV
jgi:hypothetical protein